MITITKELKFKEYNKFNQPDIKEVSRRVGRGVNCDRYTETLTDA